MRRILISGDRWFGRCRHDPEHVPFTACAEAMADRQLFVEAMRRWRLAHGQPTTIIEGCAKGGDSLGEDWAEAQDVENLHFPARWATEGRAAGPLRNQRMIDEGKPEAILAFHRNIRESKGTRDMVLRGLKHGIPTYVIPKQEGFGT